MRGQRGVMPTALLLLAALLGFQAIYAAAENATAAVADAEAGPAAAESATAAVAGAEAAPAAAESATAVVADAEVAPAAAEGVKGAAAATEDIAPATAAACPVSAGPAGGCWEPGADYVPTKGIDLNHSGMSPHVGPFSLATPAWSWKEPDVLNRGHRHLRHKVFETSPILDKDLNVYIASSTGWLYSLDKNGQLRWEYQTPAGDPGNVALLDGKVFVGSIDGTVCALSSSSGRELWRVKIAKSLPDDQHSLAAVPGNLLVACNPEGLPRLRQPLSARMNEAICAIDPENGHLRWTFFLANYSLGRFGMSSNSMPAIVGDSVIVSDNRGSVYRISLKDGREIWYAPPVVGEYQFKLIQPWGTRATSVVGPNDKVYHFFNRRHGDGVMRAHDLHTGKTVWVRRFGAEVNVAPAVGRLSQGGPLAPRPRRRGLRLSGVLVVPLGEIPRPEPSPAQSWWQRLASLLGLRDSPPSGTSKIMVIDAEEGSTIWRFWSPPFDGSVAGNLDESTPTGLGTMCLTEAWGSPTIGADGTVYVNWVGGKSFALRDANGDRWVDARSPEEVSIYHSGFGSGGASALGPGYLVVPTCRKIFAFRS